MASQRPDEEATPAEGGLVHLREFLGPTVRWVNSRLDGVYDIERAVSLNKSMQFNRDDGTILFCLLISSGHEFVATICAGTGSYAVEIKTYKTGDNAMMETWSSRVVFASPAGASVRAGNSYASLDGYISNDGERALIHYVVDYGESMCYTTTNSGNRWIQSRFPKFDSYMVSGDDEHIFFTRTGRGLAESARGQIIEAYSTRTWKLSASWTFACQPGFRHGNHSMLRSLFVDRAICCAFDASGSFDADQRLCVIGLSNGDQFHIQLDQYRASSSIYVSSDRHHMVHIPEDDGQIMYWDLKKPTYEPLFTSELPKVEKASRWVHRINGKDTVVRSSMHKQVRYCRFSPKGEVVTVAVGNDYCVVINSFLTHNFQLVYQKFFNHELYPGWVIMSIEISDGRGVSVIGAVPNKGDEAGVFGLLASFVVVPDAYDEIRELEEHFDNAESNISLVAEGGGTELHRWVITDGTLEHDAGPTVVMTESDRTQQSKLDLAMFRNQYATSPAQPVQSRITHLLTVNYPWSRTAQTSIFLLRMKSTHYVVAVGSPSIDGLQPEITRVLYVSDFSSQYHPDQLEIVQVGKQLILKVASPHDGAYSGVQFPLRHITVIGHHFMKFDAEYDLFIMKTSSHVVMPSGWSITPNTAIISTANFAAYFPPRYLSDATHLDFGFRRKSNYNLAKFMLWVSYTHRTKRNDPFFGGGELMDALCEAYDGVSDDRTYDENDTPFQSLLSCAADIDALCQSTAFVDSFLKRYHQSKSLLITNSQAISCSMPSLCRARPLGILSLMRHMALFDFHIPNNQGVEVFAKALERKEKFRVWLYRHPYLELAWVIILGVVAFILSLFRIPSSSPKSAGLANSRTVTIPLDGFCLHKYRIHGLPYVMRNWNSEPSSVFYELAGPAFYKHTKKANLPLGARPYRPVTHPRLSSPFTSFVEEVLRLDDRELQFSLLTVIWFEKLVTWKMDTFGRAIYLQRVALPLLVNVALQLALSILTADGSQSTAALVLAGIQLGVIAFLAFQKLRQMRGTWLFFRSIYNYFDIGAVALSTTMAVMVLARRTPPRAFIAYSIPILWVDMILSSRVFEQSGTLMILLTEMTRGVLPFLCLLATFIVGFTFVPFFLLQAESPPDVSNPFTDYGRALGEMITFMSNDFNSLDPWKDELVTIRILRAIFTVVVSILLLNCLIALLNLKVEAADLKSRNIWIRQMAMLLVEIERGLLTDSERRRPHWFPRWFTYILTESERRRWQDFVDRNPLDLGYGPDDDDKGKGPGIQPTTVAPAPGPSGPSQPPHSDANKSAAPTPHTSTIVPSPDANPSDKPDVPTTVPISPPTQGGSAAQSHSPHVASPSTTVENIPLVPLKSSVSQSASEEASSSSDPLSVDKCQICNLGTTLVCSNCKSARYCSAEHQLVHWKEHKKVCKGKGKVTDTA